jgi:lipopolysaccharide export system protein LptA
MMRPSVLITLLSLPLLLLSGPMAAEASEKQDVPTHITSERLRYSHHDLQIEFIGTVRVNRPGFEMRSERLLVFLEIVPAAQAVRRNEHGIVDGSGEQAQEAAEALGSQVEIEKMIAQGQVTLQYGGRVGRGEMATYWVDLEVLRLEGNAVVEEGSTRLEGNMITLNVQDEELDVLGSSERRVEGLFFLPQEKTR